MSEEQVINEEKKIDNEEILSRLDNLNKEPEVKPEKKIIDMDIEELREALFVMIKFNNQIKKEHEDFVKKIDLVWKDKKALKKRLFDLKDRTKNAKK